MTYEEREKEIYAGRWTPYDERSEKVNVWLFNQCEKYKQTEKNIWVVYRKVCERIEELFTNIYKEIEGLYPADGYPAWFEAREQMYNIMRLEHQASIFNDNHAEANLTRNEVKNG